MDIREYIYNEDEIRALYDDAGWKAYTYDMPRLKRAYDASLKVLAAYEDGSLAGIVRAVGDGVSIVFIQDIIVFGKYRRRGIGSALINALLEQYSDVRQIELVTDNTPETRAFYESAGFRELSRYGMCGFINMDNYEKRVAADIDHTAGRHVYFYPDEIMQDARAADIVGRLLVWACQPTNARLIMIGRECLTQFPQEWISDMIRRTAESAINIADDWDYRRLLELTELISPKLLGWAISLSEGSDDPDINEAADDFREHLNS